jgi:type II secretory pathway component GspD/PulD (secretin)
MKKNNGEVFYPMESKVMASVSKVLLITIILAGVLAMGASAVTVSHPKVDMVNGKTVITIPVSGEKVGFSKPIAAKKVIYIDIDDATVKERMTEMVKEGAVTKVSVSQFQTTPANKVRVVLSLVPGVTPIVAKKATSVAMEGKGITISIDNAALGKTVSGTAEQKESKPNEVQQAVAPPPPPVPPIDRPVSVAFSQADLTDVIRMLAAKSDLNIYAGPEVTGKVTIEVQNEPVGEVLKNILEVNGFTYVKVSDGSVKVIEKPSLKPTPPPPPPGPVTKVFAIDYASAGDIRTAISSLLKVDNIQTFQPPLPGKVVSGAGTIIVTAPGDVMTQVEQLIRKLDQPVKQVMIEVRLVSIEVDTDKDIGFGWDAAASGSQSGAGIALAGYSPLAGSLFSAASSGVGLITRPTSVGSIVNSGSGQFLFSIGSGTKALLGSLQAALETDKAELLSDPKLLTLNNTAATFSLVQELPYIQFQLDQQTNTITGTATFDKKSGITLTITPQITSDGRVMMHVNPVQTIHKGDVDVQEVSGAPVTSIPIINTRSADVTAMLKDGETLVIGGLREKDETSTEYSIPFLSDIPVLGTIFKQKTTQTTKNEFVIFVTPTIIPEDNGLTTEEKMMYDRVDFF